MIQVLMVIIDASSEGYLKEAVDEVKQNIDSYYAECDVSVLEMATD